MSALCCWDDDGYNYETGESVPSAAHKEAWRRVDEYQRNDPSYADVPRAEEA